MMPFSLGSSRALRTVYSLKLNSSATFFLLHEIGARVNSWIFSQRVTGVYSFSLIISTSRSKSLAFSWIFFSMCSAFFSGEKSFSKTLHTLFFIVEQAESNLLLAQLDFIWEGTAWNLSGDSPLSVKDVFISSKASSLLKVLSMSPISWKLSVGSSVSKCSSSTFFF